MLHSILPCLNISKTKLQPFLVRSRFLRHLYTRTELEGELCDIREGLQTLRELVDHPKAVKFLRAVKDSGDHPESSDEDRWAEVARRLQMPQSHHDTNKLIYDLTDFSPPQLYLPLSFHTETYKTGWKYLESSRSNSSDSVVPGEQVLFHGLALASSLFHNHVKIVSNEPIPKSCQLPDSLPSGEPVSYQIQMHDRIRLVIIEEEDLQLPDPEVYQRLFTELYAATQFNKSTVYNFYKRESLDLRVHGLLADGVRNAFFSYNPVTAKFQMDEMVYVKRGCQTALHDSMRLSEKVFSILMHAYNEFLDHWYKCIASLPQEDLTEVIQSNRTLLSLVEEAMQYANRATAQLGSPKNDDDLRRGLDDLHKSVWALPLCGRTNNCWLGLHDDLDHMAAKAVSNFRREQLYVEKQWKDARKYKTHLYCA